ncbi:MAG: methyltransferase domain-containing protein [Chloroflexi bacterium]|nr:methyltransferase domain-containing protein [Chloroflexota bacterium]MBM3175637.1 methyltransferase domain-containing protein [Chloroflexota bacterium]MBM4450241.1 methyltransferase domain-containing protein [Chloroflexota bacterium]
MGRVIRWVAMLIFNYETLVDPLFRDVREFTPEFCGMRAGDRALDVCCGTGAQVIAYGRRGIVATGIDNDPNMLKTALKNRARQRLGNVFFQLADATRLPFGDNCFDFVSVSMGLHDKARVARYGVVSEMERVVKQDGTLVFIDYAVPMNKGIWAALSRAVEFLAGGDHYAGFKDYVDSGGLEDILKAHHLREDERSYLKDGLVVIVKAQW